MCGPAATLAAVGSRLPLGIEPQSTGHDVRRDLGERTIVGERIGPQPDERVGDVDLELGCEHAGGLVDDVLEVSAGLHLGCEQPGGA